jgi:hypothetical protein
MEGFICHLWFWVFGFGSLVLEAPRITKQLGKGNRKTKDLRPNDSGKHFTSFPAAA